MGPEDLPGNGHRHIYNYHIFEFPSLAILLLEYCFSGGWLLGSPNKSGTSAAQAKMHAAHSSI